jgi:hypothetical protein
VILDAEGNELVSSDGPKGNIGAPATPLEVSWFLIMVERTRQHMTEDQFKRVCIELNEYGAKINPR